MLTRSTPMKRSGFKPRMPLPNSEANSDQALAQRAQAAMKNVVPRAATMAGSCTGVAVGKDAPVRSQKYRRAVASLPCVICGTPGYSQAAHANTGKGMGIKASDLTCFPACGPRPGNQGCHAALDQGALFPKATRRELEPVWAADTRRRIHAMGL